MQRPIPATRSLPFDEAHAALPEIRANLKYRGLTQDPYPMCAEVDRYGLGWAVYVGFQPWVDLEEAVEALGAAA
jgi:hypothetical protein